MLNTTPPKPTIREKIKKIVYDFYMPKVKVDAKSKDDKWLAPYMQALIEWHLQDSEVDEMIDKLAALLSPQTGEGECKHDQEGAFKKHCPDCGEQNLCYYCVDKHQCHPTAEEMEWEKDFDEKFLHGMKFHKSLAFDEIALEKQLSNEIKAFLRKQLDLQEKRFREMLNDEEVTGKTEIDLGVTIRNELRAELRSKLSSKK